MKIKNNATGYVVVYKEDGLICSYQRDAKGAMKVHDHRKTADNARNKFGGASDFYSEGWMVLTTVALARAKWAD
jgi:16S rRNA U516 pseudouridylate synthase RsuA-like enzyme